MWDEDEILADLNQTRDQLDRQQKPSEYILLSKNISKRFDQLRNEYYKGVVETISEAHQARNLEKMESVMDLKNISNNIFLTQTNLKIIKRK